MALTPTTPYASLTDIYALGVPQQAIQAYTTQATANLLKASSLADNYFRARWGSQSVPLLAWDDTITDAVAKIAAYWTLRVRGYASNNAGDQDFRKGYEDAVHWLEKVQKQQAHPQVQLAAYNQPGSVQPKVISSSVTNLETGSTQRSRGW